MKTLLHLLLLFCFFTNIGYSQYPYMVNYIPYTPNNYNGGVKLPVDNVVAWDDKFSDGIPIGFDFRFGWETYQYLKIGLNGVITFDTSITNTSTCPHTTTSCLPSTDYPRQCIMGYLTDLYIFDTSRSNINYYTIGSSPNRKMVINFYDIPKYGDVSGRGYTGQYVLYETSNIIEIYLQNRSSISTHDAIFGLQNTTRDSSLSLGCHLNGDSMLGFRFIHLTPPPVPIDTGIINGFTYYDVNGNCMFDSLIDSKAPLQVVRANNGINVSMSDLEGNYTMYIDSGYHTITVDSNWNFQSNCPLSHAINFTTYPDTFSGINFADSTLPCVSPIVNIMDYGLIPCDTASIIFISMQNMNPITQYNLQLIVTLNDSLQINNCSVPYTSLGANTYLLDIADTMLPFTFESVYLYCNVGCDSLGSIYSYNAILSGDNNCVTNFQDSSFNSAILVASYDPNEMLVKVANTNQPFHIENPIDSNSVLEYMITFQNSGSAAARNIRIEDVLNADHITNSIEITGSSYPCFYTLRNNIVNFSFQNINLPYGDATDPNTHGFVTFKIKQIPGHIPSNIIENMASIYFDYNSPIITNVSNAFIPYSCDKSLNVIATSPICTNEANGSIIINPDPGYGDYNYYWYNDSTENSISNLVAGIYFVEVADFLCYYTDTIELNNPNPVIVNLNANTDSVCLGDTVYLEAVGAISYDWNISTVHTNSVFDIPTSDQTYTVTGYDANMCASTMQTTTVYLKNCDIDNAIQNITNEQVKIYPTLTNDKINIDIYQENFKHIIISDLNGTVYFEANKIIKEIQVSDFPKGIYVVQLETDSKKYYQKISVY